jgi:hypothetical protein
MVRLPAEARDFSPQYKERLWGPLQSLSSVDWELLVVGVICHVVKFPTVLYYIVSSLKVRVAMPPFPLCVARLHYGIT